MMIGLCPCTRKFNHLYPCLHNFKCSWSKLGCPFKPNKNLQPPAGTHPRGFFSLKPDGNLELGQLRDRSAASTPLWLACSPPAPLSGLNTQHSSSPLDCKFSHISSQLSCSFSGSAAAAVSLRYSSTHPARVAKISQGARAVGS